MKLIFRLIKIAIIFLFIAGGFLLLINKTFIYEVYETDLMESDGIKIPRFLYLKENTDAEFYTILKTEDLKKHKDSYLNNLENCYGKYYYDKENNITITQYDIKEHDYYKTITIDYEKGNYCSNDYKLTDMWVYEFTNVSSYVSGDITEKKVTELIDKIYNSENVEPVISDYASEVEIKIDCHNNGTSYSLIFKDIGSDLLMVKKVVGNDILFTAYKIDNVSEYLRSLL